MQYEDVVSRLRVSKVKRDAKMLSEGYSFGERWAKNTAAISELEALERLDVPFLREQGASVFFHKHVAEDADYESFWHSAVGDEFHNVLINPAFIEGFFEGAFHVWEKVREQI